MTPRFGDIVRITARHDSVRWVMSPSGSFSPTDTPNVRLLRHHLNGNWSSYIVRITEVTVVERPTWEIGETVFIDDRKASILEFKEDAARVRYAPRSLPLGRSGLTHRDEGGESDIPLWRLTLDNRLHEGALL